MTSTAWRKYVHGLGPPATGRELRLWGGPTTGTAVPRRRPAVAERRLSSSCTNVLPGILKMLHSHRDTRFRLGSSQKPEVAGGSSVNSTAQVTIAPGRGRTEQA
jgi:hypothetical protein